MVYVCLVVGSWLVGWCVVGSWLPILRCSDAICLLCAYTDLHPPRNINIANITEISAVAQWEPVDADIRTVVILNEPMSKMKKICHEVIEL